MRRLFILTIIALSLLITSEGFAASSQVYDKRSIGFGTLTDGKYCIWDSATKKVICNTSAVFTGTESTTGSAGSLKSPATTGVTTITGPGAGTTRNLTIPDADVTIPATPIGLSGAMTDEQLLCGENTDGTTKAKSCGAKVTYTGEKLATFTWDGGASAVTTGATTKRCTILPFAATVTKVFAIADASTTSHLHVYQDAFATGARSTTVTGAVDIGATLGSTDTTLTSWDTSITAEDEICMSVEANDNAKWIHVIVFGTR